MVAQMINQLHQDGLGKKGLSVNAFAKPNDLSANCVQGLCREGRICKHPLTKNGGFIHLLSCYVHQKQKA